MTTVEILKIIQTAGVTVALRGGVLQARPKPSGELLELIREHKAEIIAEHAGLPELVRRAGEVSEHDAALRRELHPLFDRADELDQKSDIPGMIRILDDIRRLLQNTALSQMADKAPRNGKAGKDEVMAATSPPSGCNAEAASNSAICDPVPVFGGDNRGKAS